MTNTFMVVDDDISIIKIIEQLIKQNNLGKLLTSLTSGEDAVDEILFYNPDILLIDYLLPIKDGAEIVREVLDRGYSGKIIMVSQVEDQPMVANAYKKGVVFFIKKPINSIELVNVVKNVAQSLDLERSMSQIKNLLGQLEPAESHINKIDLRDQIQSILSDLGVIGSLGSVDLVNLIDKVILYKKRYSNSFYKLQEFYLEIANDYSPDGGLKVSSKTIEQRVRRTIQRALSNLAAMGLDDYSNPSFVDYSNLLFDFKEIRREMDYIKEVSVYRGKINIKKFIEGIISRIN